MRKCDALSDLFNRSELDFLLGVHDALSARIAQDSGFPGVWISGLGLSAASGLRDSNELSWTQVMERVELISDRLAVPALVDIDTGYGDFNNVRLVMRRLERADIGGACIEDKLFPKTNSFIGDGQDLAMVEEFCGRIKAAKDTVGSDVYLVARCEALVSGRPLEEALQRCHSYVDAGADAVLIHSKSSTPDQILSFAHAWQSHRPLAIVPTKFSQVPPATFNAAGISVAIWANQSLRAAISAMMSLSEALIEQRSMIDLESTIAHLDRVFELTDNGELEAAKLRYAAEPQRAAR
jgi:phosphoenolpyruvate phosphomutase